MEKAIELLHAKLVMQLKSVSMCQENSFQSHQLYLYVSRHFTEVKFPQATQLITTFGKIVPEM